MKFLYIFLMLLFMASCIPNEPKFEGFRVGELQQILSAQSEKNWLLTERILNDEFISLDSCQPARQLIFNYTSDANVKDSIFYVNQSANCNSISDTLKGFWFIPVLDDPLQGTDTLVIVWENIDSTYFVFDELAPIRFSMSTMSSDSLSESFEYIEPVEEDTEEEETVN